MSIQLVLGTHTSIAPGNTLLGTLSGATMTVTSVLHDGSFVPDIPTAPGINGASWRFLDWVEDFGLVVSNAEKPTLGRSAMLDALGWERGVSRALGEDDDSYRRRVLAISDTVSPNAIKRAAARVMGTIPWCYREVGAVGMRGEFFDGDLSGPSATPHGALNDAFDTAVAITVVPSIMSVLGAGFQAPVEIRGATSGELVGTGWFGVTSFFPDTVNIIMRHKPRPVAEPLELHFLLGGAPFVLAVISQTVSASWDLRKDRVMFNYEQFRGFFQICVPPLGYGEFGIAFDVGAHNAFDAAPYSNFFDGYPYLNASVLGRLYQAVDEVHAGGVAFDLCLDSTCLTPNG